MTEENYDINAMQAKVDEENAKKSEQLKKNMQAVLDKEIQDQNEINELFAKAILSEREEEERRKKEELDEELKRHEQAIEEKYEVKGIKSNTTKEKENGWKKLINNIPGMND